MPTLVHDGAVIINSSVICEYLDEVFSENSLSMSEPVGQAHMRKWLCYFEEVPTPAIRVPSFNQYLARRYETMSDDQYAQMADLGLQSMWEKAHPNITGWYVRFAARDAFARTYYRGTRLTEIFDSAG